MKQNLLNFSRSEMQETIAKLDLPRYRSDQIFTGIYAKEWKSFSRFSTLPKPLRKILDNQFVLNTLSQIDQIESKLDGTTKFLWQLSDGMKIESVIIYEGKRVTFCISSQVGCALDCKFCATGKMGILRNLTAGEIVGQVLLMKKKAKIPPTNIVYMGMGEPMNNYEQAIKAANIISDPEGLCFSRKRITISTSGILPGIYRMADENQPYSLAISLNATTQQTRTEIMPVTKKYTLDELMNAAKYYVKKSGKRITFEYILIDKLNSTLDDAKRLVKLTHSLRCKINVIPSNSDDPNYPPPHMDQVLAFDRYLNEHHRTVTVRLRKGWEIQAACGQLYAKNESKGKRRKKELPVIARN